jgi:hypothetical protein
MTANGKEVQVLELVTAGPWRRRVLEAVAALDLPDCWIGAGFLRAPVWDFLHGFERPTPLDDIDVIYFDPAHREPQADQALEPRLEALAPGLPWSVRNQARMHERNGDQAYGSSADALGHWLETPRRADPPCWRPSAWTISWEWSCARRPMRFAARIAWRPIAGGWKPRTGWPSGPRCGYCGTDRPRFRPALKGRGTKDGRFTPGP